MSNHAGSENPKVNWTDLAGELRNAIYRALLVSNKPIRVSARKSPYGLAFDLDPRVSALVRVTRLLRKEAISIYYGENTFVFDGGMREHAGAVDSFVRNRPEAVKWMRAAGLYFHWPSSRPSPASVYLNFQFELVKGYLVLREPVLNVGMPRQQQLCECSIRGVVAAINSERMGIEAKGGNLALEMVSRYLELLRNFRARHVLVPTNGQGAQRLRRCSGCGRRKVF